MGSSCTAAQPNLNSNDPCKPWYTILAYITALASQSAGLLPRGHDEENPANMGRCVRGIAITLR